MGPGPSIIGYIVDEDSFICAECLDDALNKLPLTINAAIYDDSYYYSHEQCEECHAILDPDVEECNLVNDRCHVCSHRPTIDAAIELLEQAQMELIADHGAFYEGGIVFDTTEHEQADKKLDNAQDYLRELI
jgi:hypothetical protein